MRLQLRLSGRHDNGYLTDNARRWAGSLRRLPRGLHVNKGAITSRQRSPDSTTVRRDRRRLNRPDYLVARLRLRTYTVSVRACLGASGESRSGRSSIGGEHGANTVDLETDGSTLTYSMHSVAEIQS